MKICVCEKDEKRGVICRCIRHYFEEKNAEYSIKEFHSGDVLLKDGDVSAFDFFIINTVLDDTDGINVIKELREKYYKKYFVLIAQNFEYLDAAMDLGVTRYITEPIKTEQLYAAFDRVIEQINANIVSFKNIEGFYYYYHINDIVCAEAKGRKTVITTSQNTITVNQSIREVKRLLTAPNFLSPHYSFVINKQYIAYIDANDIILKLDYHFMRVPIAAKRKSCVKKSLSL